MILIPTQKETPREDDLVLYKPTGAVYSITQWRARLEFIQMFVKFRMMSHRSATNMMSNFYTMRLN